MGAADDADLERRFGGLRRLHGDGGYQRLRAARCAVVGLGGVGSWAVEALARSGVARLVLIDLDHVAESNINRQVQALGRTLGQSKGEALRDRIADIHPGCEVLCVDEFVDADNWPALLPAPVDVLIDACDQVRAKLALAAWGLQAGVPVVCVGAAGGKQQAQRVEVADLAEVTHDPLLAGLRQRLRKALQGASTAGLGVASGATSSPAARPRRSGQGSTGPMAPLGVRCVFSRESVLMPEAPVCEPVAGEARMDGEVAAPGTEIGRVDGSLNCHGYGSSVTVTATFGMVAAGEAIAQLLSAGRAAGAGVAAKSLSIIEGCAGESH